MKLQSRRLLLPPLSLSNLYIYGMHGAHNCSVLYIMHVQIRVKDRAATVHYTVTDEVEEVDLNELMKAKEISVVESRRPPLRLGKGETVISGNGNSELDDAHHITPGTSDADDTHDDDKPLQGTAPCLSKNHSNSLSLVTSHSHVEYFCLMAVPGCT